MKKILVILTVLLLVVSFVACANNTPSTPVTPQQPTKTQLSTPTNLKVNINGLISWNSVSNATSYELTINETKVTTTTTTYQADKMLDFTVTVVAKADGYYDSESATVTYESIWKEPIIDIPAPDNVVLGIEGGSQINSNSTLQLKANVSGTDNTAVKWEVIQGSEYATISESGLITANEVTGDKTIKVKCTSDANKEVSAIKVLNIRARTELTQAMLDQIADLDTISFVGFLNINLYTIGLSSKLYLTSAVNLETAMDGNNWFATYDNGGIKQSIFYKNRNDMAYQVGVSFTNDELYEAMVDNYGEKVTWEESGLYNNFVGLKASDFTFNENEWRWVYTGKDLDLKKKMIASANPYNFDPIDFSLIIENGEILGIYSKAKDDYSIEANYKAVQELFVAIAYGDTVEVPTIAKYSTEDIHKELNEAIANMQALTSYKVTCYEAIKTIYTSSIDYQGYWETITEDMCHFEPFEVTTDGVDKPKANSSYGYKKLGDNFYNSYFEDKDGSFAPARAYNKDFATAKPTFAFAGEIFRSYAVDEEEGVTTYYVDDLMMGVASTFYYGLGTDVALYGIYASNTIITTSVYTPYVTVKDGYIIAAGFYFYLGSMYGRIDIQYSDFNSVEVATEKDVTFETREVPTSWNELTIIVTDDAEKEVNALDYLKDFLGIEDEEDVPFFGNALGDAYGFAMTTYRKGSDNKTRKCVQFYYDVPVDIDYTINSSIDAIGEYLVSEGFVRNSAGEYERGKIVVLPMDNDLDCYIYVWKK